MKYEGKYKKMAEEFRADGADELMIDKFIKEEMEKDEFEKNRGITDINAYKEWMSVPESTKEIILANAFCPNCILATIAPGYSVRKDKHGFVIEGKCQECGAELVRACY